MKATLTVSRNSLWRVGVLVLFLISAWAAFGLSGADEAAIRGFDEASGRWQSNPEFRVLAVEYCTYSSRALRTRPLLVPARRIVLSLRSIPFLPSRLAANPTSYRHYENFSRGPLSAYLHLCGEQSVPTFAEILEATGRNGEPTGADLRLLLNSFHMDYPVCEDAGAFQSAAALLRDVAPWRPLKVRANIAPLLRPHIEALARQLDAPIKPAAMSPEQQLAVLERLDAEVRRADPELWRTKQLSDFCGGVWAQVFAPSYRLIIRPIILMRFIGQGMLAGLLLRVALAQRGMDLIAEHDLRSRDLKGRRIPIGLCDKWSKRDTRRVG